MKDISAMVLAGGRPERDPAWRVEYRALALLAGKPMLAHVLQALLDAPSIGRIVIAGPPAIRDAPGLPSDQRLTWCESGFDMTDTCARAVAAAGDAEWTLPLTADVPLITGEILEGYLRECEEDLEHDAFPPLTSRQIYEVTLAGWRRTWLKFREGQFTAGNVVLTRREAWPHLLHTLREANLRRKSPLKMAAFVGFGTLLKLATGRLGYRDVADIVERRTGRDLRVVLTQNPELGADVDHPEDLPVVEAFLRGRQATRGA